MVSPAATAAAATGVIYWTLYRLLLVSSCTKTCQRDFWPVMVSAIKKLVRDHRAERQPETSLRARRHSQANQEGQRNEEQHSSLLSERTGPTAVQTRTASSTEFIEQPHGAKRTEPKSNQYPQSLAPTICEPSLQVKHPGRENV